MPEEPVTLLSLKGGAAVELFDRALEEVLRNIQDPNTEAEARRKIVLEFIFEPGKDRDVGSVFIKPSTRLAGAKPEATIVYIGRRAGGKLMAVENNPRQLAFDQGKPGPTPIDTARKERT
jgi:hypothetical protein